MTLFGYRNISYNLLDSNFVTICVMILSIYKTNLVMQYSYLRTTLISFQLFILTILVNYPNLNSST
jgi:hypothetical protein